MKPEHRAVAARAASLLLRYPDADQRAALPTVRAALAELPRRLAGEVTRPLDGVATYLADGEPLELAATYSRTFDFRRRCTLHLTYYTHGDTRVRGQALAEAAAEYRAAGFRLTGGELPDHLPTVLELASADPAGWRLLHAHRVGLDLLVASLTDVGSVYAPVVTAVRALLPPPGRDDRAAVRRLAEVGPPTEQVGLDPFPALPPTGGRR